MDLDQLQKYYCENLENRVFRFQLRKRVVDVIFYREMLCHLLGIQHIVKSKKYLGAKGYENIASGMITVSKLKKINGKGFDDVKLRFQFFSYIREILEAGDLYRFYRDRTMPATSIASDFLIFKLHDEVYLHLFLRKERENRYVAVSFIPRKVHEKNARQFVDGQEYKKIVERIILT